jgi:O-succinylbenzoic acid--CoA ligase
MLDRLASLKVGPGDRVAALLPNSPLLVELLFATWRLGATFCPLNVRLPPAQIEECLKRLDPKLYVTAEGFFPMKGETGSLGPSALLFTSGSSGRPKIAVLSEKSLRTNARAAADAVGLKREDTWLVSLPLYHVSGIGAILRCEAVGAKVAFAPERGVTHVSSVQAQLYRAVPVYPKLKCLLLGGGPIGPIPARLPVYGTYGLTEMGSMVTVQKDPVEEEGIYYLGRPLEGREVRVAEDKEVWVRGECLFEGYWESGRVEKVGEWFGTRDIGVWCEESVYSRGTGKVDE